MFCVIFSLPSCLLTKNDWQINLSPSNQPMTVDLLEQDDQMAKIGARQHPHILATFGGEYRDVRLERMVAKIVGKLTEVSENTYQTYKITILDSSNINAFALPGGYVYVTRGLLALANDSAEVAAVIAHEMAHVTANHGILRQKKAEEMALANQVIQEIVSDDVIKSDLTLYGKLSLAQFSRNQELQADAISVKTLAAAGYDPFAAPRFLQVMAAYARLMDRTGNAETAMDFLATHPATPQRIQIAVEFAEDAHKTMPQSMRDRREREAFLKGIDGMIYGDYSPDGYMRGNYFVHPELDLLFELPSGFSLNQVRPAVIANGPDDIAVRFDVVAVSETISPEDYMKRGWISGLDEKTIRSYKIQNYPAASAYAQNENWQFDVTVIYIQKKMYRFLTAAPIHTKNLDFLAQSITGSLRILSMREKKIWLKPLRVHIMQIPAGATLSSLAQSMQDVANKMTLFQVFNGLAHGSTLSAGNFVKIISE